MDEPSSAADRTPGAAGVVRLLLAVTLADEQRTARRFVGETAIPLVFDPRWEVAHRFGSEKLPETHLVVRGEVVDRFVGATPWADRTIRERLQKWMAMPPSAAP